MKLSKLWMAGFVALAVAAVAMVAVACGEAEPAPAPEPAMSAADIADAVRSAVSESQMSEADMAAMMSDQIAEQVAAMAAANPGLSAEEVNAMIAEAVGGASAMLGDQLAMMEEGMSDEEMMAMMEEAIASAVDSAVMEAMPEPAEEMMEPERGTTGPKHGGTLSVATTGFQTFDPDLMGVGAGGDMFYFHRVFDGLIEVGREGELVNMAVESWEANADLSVYTMKVRPGMQFHDGEAVEAADVKYTIDRMIDPESSAPVRSTLSYLELIEAPDAHTLIFNLNGSNPEFPRDLSDYHLRILPSHVDYSKITDGSIGGSGPFVKFSHNSAEKTAYVRNSNYWDGDKPYLDQLVLYYMPELTTRMEALRAGALDYGGVEDLSQLQWFQDHDRFGVIAIPTGALRNFPMDNREPGMYLRPGSTDETDLIEGGSVFHDKNLRKAVQYGYDRQFLADAGLYGAGVIANDHPVVSFDQYYWEDQVQVERDIERAKGVSCGGRIRGRHRRNSRCHGALRNAEHEPSLEGEPCRDRHQRRGRGSPCGHVLDGGVACDALQRRLLGRPSREPGAVAASAEHGRLERVALEQPAVRRVAGPCADGVGLPEEEGLLRSDPGAPDRRGADHLHLLRTGHRRALGPRVRLGTATVLPLVLPGLVDREVGTEFVC